MELGGGTSGIEPGAPTMAREESGFLRRVFAWMFIGLVLTGVVAWIVGSNQALLDAVTGNAALLIGIFVLQIAVVLVLIFALPRIHPTLAAILFLAYAALVGFTFAFVFQLYTTQSIFTTFLVTSVMFGSLAAWGAFTDIDLSRLGPILFAALIGFLVATVVNIFLANSTLYWITTYAGVAIFAGLTAYDMQKLKQISQQGIQGAEASRMSIFGALSLYLDFINLFLLLLRIFGQNR